MLLQADPNEVLQAETAELNTLLYQAIEEIAGRESTSTITQLHRLCHAWRRGVPDAERKLGNLVASLDEERLRIVIRSIQSVAGRGQPGRRPPTGSGLARAHAEIVSAGAQRVDRSCLLELKHAGKSAADIQHLLDSLSIELVFTAHPTEAKRRSIRNKVAAAA